MALYTRIIVPLDGSKLAESALPEAKQLAKLTGAELVLIRVVDYSARDKFGDFGLLYEYEAMAQALAEERELAKAYLADMVRTIEAEGYPVSATLVDGIAAKAIVGMTQPGDVIVMATHGRTGMKRWFIGSIAEDVAAARNGAGSVSPGDGYRTRRRTGGLTEGGQHVLARRRIAHTQDGIPRVAPFHRRHGDRLGAPLSFACAPPRAAATARSPEAGIPGR